MEELSRKILYILMITLGLLSLYVSGCNLDNSSKATSITFNQLFANPNQYKGQEITIEGFIFLGFEAMVLSEELLTSGYANNHLIPGERVLWLEGGIPTDIYDELYEQHVVSPDERYGKIVVEGKFHYGSNYGHLGAYKYQITPKQMRLLPWTPPFVYSIPELKYLLIDHFDDIFHIDPDYYPVAREGQEEKNAREQFTAIRENEVEFMAILERLGLPNKTDYTDEEILRIYREHKLLSQAVNITPSQEIYLFELRIKEGQGERIEGSITLSGKIEILKREPSFNTYPICLVKGIKIETPHGLVAVEDIQTGMAIWSLDNSGKRIVVDIIKTSTTPVPECFLVIKLELADGRTVTASAGHPTAEDCAIGDYQIGDHLDGTRIETLQYVTYEADMTYDLLPNGTTRLYWANGILLKSTLTSE
jgi:hypothetical protein